MRAAAISAIDRPTEPDRDLRYHRNIAKAATSVEELDLFLGGRLFVLLCVFTPKMREIHEQLLGPSFRCSLPHSRMRRQMGNLAGRQNKFVWHQDAVFGCAPGRMVNIWIALDRCGEDAPSIQVFEYATEETLPHETTWEELCERYGAHPIQTFVAEPGDAVIITSKTFHCTQAGERLDFDRHSIDIRSVEANITPSIMLGGAFVAVDELAYMSDYSK